MNNIVPLIFLNLVKLFLIKTNQLKIYQNAKNKLKSETFVENS